MVNHRAEFPADALLFAFVTITLSTLTVDTGHYCVDTDTNPNWIHGDLSVRLLQNE